MDSFGHEWGAGRPAVIVSGDAGNRTCPTVIVAYTTTQKKPSMPIHVRVKIDGVPNVIMCNAVRHVDKELLERKIWTLTESEMIRVGGALAVAMCIPQYPAKTVVEPPKQTADDTVALRCERDMWQRMYETVLNQLVEMRVNADLARAEAKAPVMEEPVIEDESVVEPAPVVGRVPVERGVVDINHCSEMALREMGLSEVDCTSIISCRPFQSVLELNCVPDLDTKWVAANEGRFICTPIATEVVKVNLNTCAARELIGLGIKSSTAYKITSYRKHHGPFASVGELVNVPSVGQRFVDTWADKLEV